MHVKRYIRVPEKVLTADGVLNFILVGSGVSLLNSDELTIHAFDPGESIMNVRVSANKKIVLIMVSVMTPVNSRMRRYDYSRLVVIWRENGKWKSRSHLRYMMPPMEKGRRWVADITAIGNDRMSAVLKLASMSEVAPYQVTYRAVPLDLATGQKLNELPNDLKSTEAKVP